MSEGKTSNNVMLISKWGKKDVSSPVVMYRVGCDCLSTDHEATLSLEYNHDLSCVTMTLYKNVAFISYLYDEKKIIDKLRMFWYRLKNAIKLLFTGYLEMEGDLIFDGPDHIDSLIQALKEGKEFILKENEGDGI